MMVLELQKQIKKEFEFWVQEFNLLRETRTIDKYKYGNAVYFMDLLVFKGDRFMEHGKLDISVFQKEGNKEFHPQRIT